jgi:type III pantothenate kinase
MKPHVVVDIGNTRLKWGLVDPEQSALLATESLPDAPATWQQTIDQWLTLPPYQHVREPLSWVVASVNPGRTERLRGWIEGRDDTFFHLQKASQLPLQIDVEHPDRVGIDRLLNAVAVARTATPGRGSILIDAGSAVTVDWLDERHVFCGGSIFPGVELMAEALHRYTALLPRVSLSLPVPELPAKSTIAAMQVGIFLAVSGGIREAVRRYAERAEVSPRVCFTGGQAPLLTAAMGLDGLPSDAPLPPVAHVPGSPRTPVAHAPGSPSPWNDFRLWPNQTLVGILSSAEALP